MARHPVGDETRRRLDHLIAAIETGSQVAVLTPPLVEHQKELARLDAALPRCVVCPRLAT